MLYFDIASPQGEYDLYKINHNATRNLLAGTIDYAVDYRIVNKNEQPDGEDHPWITTSTVEINNDYASGSFLKSYGSGGGLDTRPTINLNVTFAAINAINYSQADTGLRAWFNERYARRQELTNSENDGFNNLWNDFVLGKNPNLTPITDHLPINVDGKNNRHVLSRNITYNPDERSISVSVSWTMFPVPFNIQNTISHSYDVKTDQGSQKEVITLNGTITGLMDNDFAEGTRKSRYEVASNAFTGMTPTQYEDILEDKLDTTLIVGLDNDTDTVDLSDPSVAGRLSGPGYVAAITKEELGWGGDADNPLAFDLYETTVVLTSKEISHDHFSGSINFSYTWEKSPSDTFYTLTTEASVDADMQTRVWTCNLTVSVQGLGPNENTRWLNANLYDIHNERALGAAIDSVIYDLLNPQWSIGQQVTLSKNAATNAGVEYGVRVSENVGTNILQQTAQNFPGRGAGVGNNPRLYANRWTANIKSITAQTDKKSGLIVYTVLCNGHLDAEWDESPFYMTYSVDSSIDMDSQIETVNLNGTVQGYGLRLISTFDGNYGSFEDAQVPLANRTYKLTLYRDDPRDYNIDHDDPVVTWKDPTIENTRLDAGGVRGRMYTHTQYNALRGFNYLVGLNNFGIGNMWGSNDVDTDHIEWDNGTFADSNPLETIDIMEPRYLEKYQAGGRITTQSHSQDPETGTVTFSMSKTWKRRSQLEMWILDHIHQRTDGNLYRIKMKGVNDRTSNFYHYLSLFDFITDLSITQDIQNSPPNVAEIAAIGRPLPVLQYLNTRSFTRISINLSVSFARWLPDTIFYTMVSDPRGVRTTPPNGSSYGGDSIWGHAIDAYVLRVVGSDRHNILSRDYAGLGAAWPIEMASSMNLDEINKTISISRSYIVNASRLDFKVWSNELGLNRESDRTSGVGTDMDWSDDYDTEQRKSQVETSSNRQKSETF